MEEQAAKIPVYISAAKVLLLAVGPAQRLLQSPAVTHWMINRQAMVILYNDGFIKKSQILEKFAPDLDKGVSWADSGFRNMSHFFNPRTFKGIYGWTDAVGECSVFWNKALKYWRQVDYGKAFFYLGAAAHLLQDLCVPHHAMGILFDGHREYEDWVKGERDNYVVENGGSYGLAETPGGWLRQNALSAVRYYHLVRSGSSQQHYRKATQVLLPRAQRSTAGFIHYFLNKVGV